MVFICNNESSVHYGRTKADIHKQMKSENYDFDSWCDRAPAMWINIPDSLYNAIIKNSSPRHHS